MIRQPIVDSLRNYIPSDIWSLCWFLPSTGAIILLPLGLLFFQFLEFFEVYEPRGQQMLGIFSVFAGIGIGLMTLFLVDKAEISMENTRRVKVLAGLSIVSPILIISIIFWIYSRP